MQGSNIQMLDSIKSTCDLKINSSFGKITNQVSLVNDKLDIYDDRVASIEKVLNEKIKYIKNSNKQNNTKLLDNLIEQLRTKNEKLEVQNSTLTLQ